MVDEKQWYLSKTIWGALIAVAASFAGIFGIQLDEVTQGDLSDAIIQLVAGIGALTAIYGRLSATDIIQ